MNRVLNGIYDLEMLYKRLDKIQEIIADMRRIAVEPAIKRSKEVVVKINERQDKIDDLTRELLNIKNELKKKSSNETKS